PVPSNTTRVRLAGADCFGGWLACCPREAERTTSRNTEYHRTRLILMASSGDQDIHPAARRVARGFRTSRWRAIRLATDRRVSAPCCHTPRRAHGIARRVYSDSRSRGICVERITRDEQGLKDEPRIHLERCGLRGYVLAVGRTCRVRERPSYLINVPC